MNDSFLQEQGVSGALIESVRKFRESYPVAEGLENRMSTPEIPFFGKEILEMAIAALLQGVPDRCCQHGVLRCFGR